jgi:hypothetical protein
MYSVVHANPWARRLLTATVLLAGALMALGLTAKASFAATAPAHPAAATLAAVRLDTTAVPLDAAPQGKYDTSVTFCDAKDHTWWANANYFIAYYNGSGHWQGRNYQDYDVVDCTFGGCWDIGFYYRWC